uniref:Uncharacterized protein n=1 Tax=Solanum lycopersicum TaxID=4081 RepID=A0A3Q7G0F6_SOLLC
MELDSINIILRKILKHPSQSATTICLSNFFLWSHCVLSWLSQTTTIRLGFDPTP